MENAQSSDSLQSWCYIYRQDRQHGDQRVQQTWRGPAGALRTWVWLGQGAVVAEETLGVYRKCVRVFKVVREDDGSGHQDKLKIEHLLRPITGAIARGGPKQR